MKCSIDNLILTVILIICGLVFGLTVWWMSSEEQSRLFIMREYMTETDRGPAKIIEYFIDGLPSVAVFYDSDAEQLEKFRAYLRSVSR